MIVARISTETTARPPSATSARPRTFRLPPSSASRSTWTTPSSRSPPSTLASASSATTTTSPSPCSAPPVGAAGHRGWRVFADFGLIGMDHTPLSQVTNPRLTTVGHDLAAIARAAAATALRALGEQFPVPAPDIDLRVIPGESA
ncbi:substrate-binding domain-containing protein [Streptomyces sp. 8K308]|uniref:substrate-binding domain-containing protein n=1 Tax=Streptomyces sp. 8K308 TaxID=2530388 RepID=UPI0014054B47|nr:substrate-binding domain-containing protein [Streptomyces sp. 8K308]